MPRLFTSAEGVRREATRTASRLGIKEVGPTLRRLAADVNGSPAARAEALVARQGIAYPELGEGTEQALSDAEPVLRREARRLLAGREPERAVKLLAAV